MVAYLSFSPFYSVLTEVERNKGFIDIYLKKAPNIVDDIVEGVIELKYIPRAKFTKDLLEKKVAEAKAQIKRYGLKKNEKGVILVFNGWELVYVGEGED